MNLRVFIGYDPREDEAYRVAARTAESYGCVVTPLRDDVLRASGILTRPMDTRGGMWDLTSSSPQSTRFAIARFFVPILAHSGMALFVDCDVVFLRDPHELLREVDMTKAVSVVKHGPLTSSEPKMDGQPQVPYWRKNWSSVCLWNVSHPANMRVSLAMLNGWHRADLHAFRWLHDDEIGELAPEWNWLVGVQKKPANPAIAHYTLGTPNMVGHEADPHAELWTEASKR